MGKIIAWGGDPLLAQLLAAHLGSELPNTKPKHPKQQKQARKQQKRARNQQKQARKRNKR